jgi:PKD repeat protein
MSGTAAPGRARYGVELLLLGALGCAREAAGPDLRESEPQDALPTGFVVSSPVEQAAGVLVAYVSATPGTITEGGQVRVSNLADAGRSTTALVNEGGFDPVPVPADAGDLLQIVTTDSAGNARQVTQTVAARLPVRVVRVQPSARRTDVPLNARIEVVFSAPVALTSAEGGIRLTRDGEVVASSISASEPLAMLITLVPDAPLAPSSFYRLEVTRGVRGVNGLPLGESVVVEFRTASDSGASSPPGDSGTSSPPSQPGTNAPPSASFRVNCAGLSCQFQDQSTDPDPGDSVVTRIWEFGDGGIVRDVGSPAHAFGLAGTYTVTLTVTDRQRAEHSHSHRVTVASDLAVILPGTYERVTPHDTPGRHSRIVVAVDGTFEYHDETGTSRVVHRGRWDATPENLLVHTVFRFDSIAAAHPELSSESETAALGSRLQGSEIGLNFSQFMRSAGFEPGIYGSDVAPRPTSPPPQEGTIAFVREGRIYVGSTHGGVPVQLTTGPDDLDPAWSPDGSRIAFRRVGGSAPGIYVMDADGSNAVLRTAGESYTNYPWSPAWSPDGEWVGFACNRPGATIFEPAICRVRATGPDTTRMLVYTPVRGALVDPAWSPDGTAIAYTSDWNAFDFAFDIWTVRPDGSDARTLNYSFATGFEHYQPAWSPEGSRIAYIECPWAFVQCTVSVVSVMDATGFGSTRLAAALGFSSPTWSRDGQVIAFGTGNDIEWVSADGRQRGRILSNGHSPSWRP